MIQERLINSARAGKLSAKKKLFKTLYGKVHAVSMRYTHDDAQASYVTIEICEQIFKSLDRFESGDFFNWCKKIAIEKAVELSMINGEERRLEFDESFDEIDDCDLSPIQIISLLRELPSFNRIVFNLLAIDSYSIEDIAIMLNTDHRKIEMARNTSGKFLENRICEMSNAK